MADEFIVIIPNEAIRRFEKTDGGYYVYVWGRKWLPDGYVSDATAERLGDPEMWDINCDILRDTFDFDDGVLGIFL